MMKITSSAFTHGEMIPKKYTCDGDDISPPLEIEAPPADTKSFVLIVHDPDAPSRDFVHWILWNIDPLAREIKEGEIPQKAKEGSNDTGLRSWKGPCPPSGTHSYYFHFYALNTTLDISEMSDKRDIRYKIRGHILEEASLVGLYKRESLGNK